MAQNPVKDHSVFYTSSLQYALQPATTTTPTSIHPVFLQSADGTLLYFNPAYHLLPTQAFPVRQGIISPVPSSEPTAPTFQPQIHTNPAVSHRPRLVSLLNSNAGRQQVLQTSSTYSWQPACDNQNSNAGRQQVLQTSSTYSWQPPCHNQKSSLLNTNADRQQVHLTSSTYSWRPPCDNQQSSFGQAVVSVPQFHPNSPKCHVSAPNKTVYEGTLVTNSSPQFDCDFHVSISNEYENETGQGNYNVVLNDLQSLDSVDISDDSEDLGASNSSFVPQATHVRLSNCYEEIQHWNPVVSLSRIQLQTSTNSVLSPTHGQKLDKNGSDIKVPSLCPSLHSKLVKKKAPTHRSSGKSKTSSNKGRPALADVKNVCDKERTEVVIRVKKSPTGAVTHVKKTLKKQKRKKAAQKKRHWIEEDDGIPEYAKFFKVIRSQRAGKRKTSREKQEDMEREMEEKILNGCEDGLKVVEIEGKGRGVVADKVFEKDDFVVEYLGELVNITTADQRERLYAQDEQVGCYMYYFDHKTKHYCIDATTETGKLGRLLNHSRKGNCQAKVVAIEDTPHLVLVAAQRIEQGEELTYDYGDRSPDAVLNHPWLKL